MERAKELPRGWVNCYLNDFCKINMGQSPDSCTYNNKSEGLPFYQGKTEFGQLYPKPVKYCNAPNKIGDVGDVLLSVRAPVGPTNLLNHKACIGRGLAAIKPLGGIQSKFILHLFRNIENELSNKGTGTTFKAINKDLICFIKFNLPPLPEQQRIVAKIEELSSELDKGVESLKTGQQQLKVYRQAVLKWAFEGKLTEEWKKKQLGLKYESELLRLIENEHIEIYKKNINNWEIDSIRAKNEGRRLQTKPQIQNKKIEPDNEDRANLCDIPEGWVYVYLNCLGDLARGKSKHRPRNDPKLFENGTYPFIQTGEVKAANKFIKQFSAVYSDFGLSQSKLWPVGTLCITVAANIAESAFLAIDACFPDSVVGFRAFDNIVLPEYVFYFMESAKQRIAAYAPATAQKNINLETLENLIIPLCSVAEQAQIVQEIESRLSVCDKMEESIEKSLAQAEALRQSILKKAFEGRLVPQDPNDEPAEKLLERIWAERESQNSTPKPSRKKLKEQSNE